jgi:hypothetical protein
MRISNNSGTPLPKTPMTKHTNDHFHRAVRFIRLAVGVGALAAALSLLSRADGASGTWILNPVSGDWNTAANWTPPNVPTDTAEFDVSNQAEISFSVEGLISISEIVFGTGANPYAFTPLPGQTLVAQGDGVINSSTAVQNFIAVGGMLGVLAKSALLYRPARAL